MHEFRPGDRVQLTKLGELRHPRKSSKVGTVLASKSKSGPASALILFDGTKVPRRLHRSYIEPIDELSKGQR